MTDFWCAGADLGATGVVGGAAAAEGGFWSESAASLEEDAPEERFKLSVEDEALGADVVGARELWVVVVEGDVDECEGA